MSLARLEEHRRVWNRKRALARIYGVWFNRLLAELRADSRVLEVGAGPGFLSDYARRHRADLRLWSCDLIAAPWNDFTANGESLPIRTASLDGVLAFDVIHHLADPAAFFGECRRVLVSRGRVVVVEPWVTPFSFPIYKWIHREGCHCDLDPWRPFAGVAGKTPFEGDAGVFKGMIRRTSDAHWRRLGFEPPLLTPLSGFAYLLSLGFIDHTLLPDRLTTLLIAVDRRLESLARCLGMRAMAVWIRSGDDSSE
ncbi:MAG: class I SAM-dependent methyltransferase [Vicinamibacteria bacterium]|nr:class I SAM-dependent methyltransferase [Vicinamibacteria bacterium]